MRVWFENFPNCDVCDELMTEIVKVYSDYFRNSQLNQVQKQEKIN